MALQQFQDLARAADELAFRRGLEGFVSEMGFEKYIACMVYAANTPGAAATMVTVSNAPAEFVALSTLESTRRDPVLAKLRALSVPFYYDRGLYEGAVAADLWEEQAAYGYVSSAHRRCF